MSLTHGEPDWCLVESGKVECLFASLVIGEFRLPVLRKPCNAHPEGLVWLVLIGRDPPTPYQHGWALTLSFRWSLTRNQPRESPCVLMPVTASGAASDVLAADVQIFLCVEALLMR